MFTAMILTLAAVAAQPALTVADARRSLLGRWEGKLEYRDYQADKWFGLPVKVEVKDGGDGVTLVRTADYDDGPTTGNVRITTVSMLLTDGTRESSASFRKGRDVELQTSMLTLSVAHDRDHWTLVETTTARDDDRPATIRLTTTRDGASLVTLKSTSPTMPRPNGWPATGPP